MWPKKTDEVIDALLKLSEDADGDVRYEAAWQGLIPVPNQKRRKSSAGS